MKEVKLSMKEQNYYEVIKELVDHKGNKDRAAKKLGITVRHVNRLIMKYKDKGKAGFVHGNKTRQPINSLPQELNEQILNLYRDKYQAFNFSHFKDMLEEFENIHVSYAHIYTLLTSNGIYPPNEHRRTKKERAKRKVLAAKKDISQEDLEVAISHEMALEDSHPRKPRAKNFGEQLQTDASIHEWFGEIKTALHLSIDNASGQILGAYFDYQETLHGYYTIFKQILLNYGIPYLFLTDNRTVFNYERTNKKDDSKDVLTQFGYACHILGVQLETTSVSQAKGQVERCNGTFQGRLVNELRLFNITTIEEANEYLIKIFVPRFNKRFALPIESFPSVMEKSPSEEEINRILSVLSPRKIDGGSAVKYKNNYYQIYNEDGDLMCFEKGTDCLVINSFTGELFITIDEKVYSLKKFESHKNKSEAFEEIEEPKPKKIYIPPMSHPWKHKLFVQRQKMAHQHHIYT